MAHNTIKPSYTALQQRLNSQPQGAPQSETLYAILKLLFSEREAELVAALPVRPFTVGQAAQRWHMPLAEARRVLDELAGRAILVDSELPNGERSYVLPPPMAGFFEFSLMRLSDNPDQKVLGQLFYQYLNVEEDFIRALFAPTGTPLGRIFVQETALPAAIPPGGEPLQILDYERASEAIRSASHIGVSLCYCRHKMQHAEQSCSAPMEICLTLNNVAASLTNHGYARQIDASEGLDLIQQAYACGLVQCGENVRQRVTFICNCCGCCCEALTAARRFGFLTPVATTNFLPVIDEDTCSGCGKCVDACPVQAVGLVSAKDPQKPKRRLARIDEDICLGCGVCVNACRTQAVSLKNRPQRVITPVDSIHRVVRMAIERNRLPQLIFDNQALFSHRALAAVLGAILRLPPAKQALANEQLKSRYLERLILWAEKPAG